MKTNAKRLLSLTICLIMVLSMMPVVSFAASTTLVYCQAPDNWVVCNAYWWGSDTDTNPDWPGLSMVKNEDGIWYIEVPTDAVGLIFSNGNGIQTPDLTVPTDNKVMYVFGGGYWTTYGKVDVKTYDYYVAGEAALCGDNWSPCSPANGMTDEDGDGIYTITYKNVAAGSYQLKVTDGTWDNSWGANGGSGNYVLALGDDAETLELRFNSATHRISVVGLEAAEAVYYVSGNMNEWSVAAKEYQMTKQGDNYVLTLVLTAGNYELKITDGSWDNSWGDGDSNYCFTVRSACPVTITFNADGSTITVTGAGVGEEEKLPLSISSVHAVGSEGLTGEEWNLKGGVMAEQNGVYSITFEDVPAGSYEFKFLANGNWDLSWGYGAQMEPGVIYDAWVDGGNNTLVIPEGTATVTLTLDLSAMDRFTGEGAKCSVAMKIQLTELIAEGTAVFKDADAAFDGESVIFTPETDGVVTVEILSCRPGFYLDVYCDGEWLVDFDGKTAQTVAFDVKGESEIKLVICSYSIQSDFVKEAAPGTVSYKVSFTSDGGHSGGNAPELPDDVFNEPGGSMDNPKMITSEDLSVIPGNTSVWYYFDNYQNMVDNGVYSMILRVNAGVSYSVIYNGEELPVDKDGFVNYEMKDQDRQGQYIFCVTNLDAEEAFFSVAVENIPAYINNGGVLTVGYNNIDLDSSAVNTLYEFAPTATGVYRITVGDGVVGEWGSAFNPQDNTENKTNTMEWTCTAVGQSVMIGFAGADSAIAVVQRIGNYTPEEELPYTVYENTYDFSYTLPAGKPVDIDLLDGGKHSVVLGADGFYHYGLACGPLVVTDLSQVEIDIQDAYANGGLRVWFVDNNGVTVSKTDYNEAMNEYLEAGLVPVTEELAMMLSQLGENKSWWNANGFVFGENVPGDLSQAWLQLCAYLEGSGEHTYENGLCTGCGAEDPNYVKEYYLFGYINGANYGCEEDYENMGQYKFVNGKLVATFDEDSYVAVKTSGNRNWFMTNGWQGDATSATLYDTAKETVDANKLSVPGNVELTFTLKENKDGTLTLSYVITACDHSYSEKITVKPGCETEGVKTFTCDHCGHSYQQTLPAAGHSYSEEVTKEPGCETQGEKTFTCENCDDSYTQSIPALGGHNYSENITVKPGCETQGEKTLICQNCGHSSTQSIPALGGHDYEESITTKPGCETVGKKTFTCQNCGHSYSQTIPTLGGHDYEERITTEPSCETNGQKTFTCANCGDSYSQPIPSLGGHSYSEKITVNPGCETTGKKIFTCENCGDSYSQTIPPLGGHDYKESVTKEPGCETEGEKTFTCANCGDSYSQPIPSLGGHSYSTAVTKEPGCETEGEKTFTCEICGYSYTESVPSLGGHVYEGGKCTVCGAADSDYVKNYYLFGYINGANYACEEDYENMGQYKFVNGQLTATFTQDSYVAVKTEGNGAWFMTNGWLGEATTATLYDTAKETVDANKLYVPANVELTFTLVENEDGTLTLSYEKAASYRVSFVVPEGIPSVEDMVCGAEGITLPAAGTPTGAHSYVFVGWVEAKTQDTTVVPSIYTGAYIPTADTTLYALYTYTEGGSAEGGWKQVTDASSLTAGDRLVLGFSSKGKVASVINKQVLTAVDAVFSEDGTTVSLPADAQILTLALSNGQWQLLNEDGKALGCTSAKKLAWGDGTMTWTITFDEAGDATIASTEGTLGRILYNVTSPRFTTYTSNVTASMALPQLYKLEGEVGSTYYTTEITTAPQGTSVSGTIISSSLVEGNVTVELWLEGAASAAYTTVTGSGMYTFENVLPGSYTLMVRKNNHVTRSYEITVGSEAVSQAVKIQLLGDITGDGQINIGDVAKVYAHIKGTVLLKDDYLLDCANGNGGSLNIGDVASIYAHVKGTKTFF